VRNSQRTVGSRTGVRVDGPPIGCVFVVTVLPDAGGGGGRCTGAGGAGAAQRAARAAHVLAREWAGASGAGVRTVEVSDGGAGRRGRHGGRATLGARNRRLAAEIAAAAESYGADVIVLGIDHRRLTARRLAPSLRDQLTRATTLPVLVAPRAGTAAATGVGAATSGAPAVGRTVAPDDEERYARV